MNISKALSAVVNVAVIVAIAFYLWRTADPNDARESSDNRSSAVDLSREEWGRITRSGSRLGDVAARAVLVEFVDYQCPYCSTVNPLIERYLRRHPDKAVIIVHYPLAVHAAAEGAARAAICAESQGKFARMHSVLFERKDWHMDPDWNGLAEDIGIPDIAEFDRCLGSPETRVRIDADRALAMEFGVRATPTFISRHSIHEGSLDRWTLARLASTDPAR